MSVESGSIVVLRCQDSLALVKSEVSAPPPLEAATSPPVPVLSTEESKSLPEISHARRHNQLSTQQRPYIFTQFFQNRKLIGV